MNIQTRRLIYRANTTPIKLKWLTHLFAYFVIFARTHFFLFILFPVVFHYNFLPGSIIISFTKSCHVKRMEKKNDNGRPETSELTEEKPSSVQWFSFHMRCTFRINFWFIAFIQSPMIFGDEKRSAQESLYPDEITKKRAKEKMFWLRFLTLNMLFHFIIFHWHNFSNKEKEYWNNFSFNIDSVTFFLVQCHFFFQMKFNYA